MNTLYVPQFQYLNFESVQNGLSDFNSEEQFRCFRYDLKISVSMIPGNIDNEKISAIRHTVLNDILVKNASDFFLYDGSIEKLTVDLVSLRLRSIECYWIVLGEPLENNASLINSYFEIFKSIVKSKGVIFCDKKFGNFYENVSYLIDLLWGMQPMMETPRTSFPKVHVRPTRVKNVVASEPSQPSEERFISVRTFQRRENDFVLEKRSFLIGIESKIVIRISPPDMDWLSSNNSFPQKELPEKQKFWKLSVVITESNHIPKKLSGQEIMLPQKGPSTECEFIFTPQNLKEFEGFIVVSYKQRVLQIATLKIPIIENESKLSPSDSISLTNQALLYRLEDGEKRAKVDLSLITNKTAELTMILPSSAFQYKLDNCKDITISINEKISQIANSEEDYENGYESKKGQQLLKDLIIRGRTLYEQILNKELEEKCEQLQYIQIISNNDVKNTIPFEFIYDREYPHESATLCKIWNQCPSPPNCTEKDFKEILCPFGFWGLNKLIERHIISTSHASKNKPYIEKEELSKRGKFKISEPCLIAASHHVKPEDLEKIASTVLELTGFPPVKANWDNWIEMIKAFKPRLIIVLPHMEAISEFEATLEINTKKKPYRDITEAHIRANAEYRPIVALLGCDTAGTEFKYIDFVQTFSDNKAGIVIGTVASILGIHASKIAEMLLKGLEEVKENTRLSDLMRIIKCKAIKDNLIMAMSVVAFGDADWILTKK